MSTGQSLEPPHTHVPQVWNVLEVLNVLQALVDKSGITTELEADGGAK